MKIGDKVYCKKTYHNDDLSYIFFEKGNLYTIVDMYLTINQIPLIMIDDEIGEFKYVFSHITDDRPDFTSLIPFNQYFMTPKEYRKLKLSKIKNTIS